MKAKYKWHYPAVHAVEVEKLATSLQKSVLFTQLLLQRNLTTVEKIQAFLAVDDQPFYDPFLFNDMKKATDRIHEAIRSRALIYIYGDYDADGVTSTTVLLKTLQNLGANVDFYIPNRFTEGYGMNEQAVRELKSRGCDLIVTVDTGVSAVKEIALANELGMDVILTDHHEFADETPNAYAIIHPKRVGESFPFHELAGVGVSFKLACALGAKEEELLPYVAIGTVADLVPLVDENRRLVKRGLEQLRKTNASGLLALFEVSNIEQQAITEETIGFSIGPRINAIGRMQSADDAVHLFMSTSEIASKTLATKLDTINNERKSVVEQISEEAIAMVEKEYKGDNFFIVAKEGWNAGVLGIVAAKLVEIYHRPVIALAIDREKGVAKGSARSIEALDLYETMRVKRDWMTHFGGHPMAAGLTIPIENIDKMRSYMNDYCTENLHQEDFLPSIRANASCNLQDVTVKSIEEIQQLAPFGVGNSKPLIYIEDIYMKSARLIGQLNNHGKFQFQNSNGTKMDGIWFKEIDKTLKAMHHDKVSILCEPDINEWNGRRTPQLKIQDMTSETTTWIDWREKGKIMDSFSRFAIPKSVVLFFNEQHFEQYAKHFQCETLLVQDSFTDGQGIKIAEKNVLIFDVPPKNIWNALLENASAVDTIFVFGFSLMKNTLQMPSLDVFRTLYRQLMTQPVWQMNQMLEMAVPALQLSQLTIEAMCKVFMEAGLLLIEEGTLTILPSSTKSDITQTKAYEWLFVQTEWENYFRTVSFQELQLPHMQRVQV